MPWAQNVWNENAGDLWTVFENIVKIVSYFQMNAMHYKHFQKKKIFILNYYYKIHPLISEHDEDLFIFFQMRTFFVIIVVVVIVSTKSPSIIIRPHTSTSANSIYLCNRDFLFLPSIILFAPVELPHLLTPTLQVKSSYNLFVERVLWI